MNTPEEPPKIAASVPDMIVNDCNDSIEIFSRLIVPKEQSFKGTPFIDACTLCICDPKIDMLLNNPLSPRCLVIKGLDKEIISAVFNALIS